MNGSIYRERLLGNNCGSLNHYRPDKDRIKEVGANRACAEWLLRCGAHVRWVGIPTWQTDYNSLPSGEFHKFKIEEVNADDAAVMDMGFAHFGLYSLFIRLVSLKKTAIRLSPLKD